MKKALWLSILLGCTVMCFCQDTIPERVLEPVTIGANKWQQPMNEVPNKITRIDKQEIFHQNPQTSADLLSQTGTVFVQKSQLGGGSPMIRGFATNRVLLVVDGVRMNNAIYRSGNLQNVISIDALSTESAEVIFGPGSLIYGSDAIGGVMDFHTLGAKLAENQNHFFSGNVLTRYSTANKEKTVHADFNTGTRKFSILGAFTYSDFADLKMGKNGGEESYLRKEYVERINNSDVIVPNNDPRIQRFSGYNQTNFLGKMRYKPSEHLDIQYSFNHAKTGNAPRYDRLIQYRNGNLRFAEWYYGPMVWNVHQLQALLTSESKFWDQLKVITAYQDYEESRIDRTRGNDLRTKQSESVDAFSLNIDATKVIGKGEFFYGLEHVYNKIGSSGMRTDISNGNSSPFVSRYPDGSTWTTSGVYASYKMNIDTKFTFTTGLRYAYNTLNATFDTTYIPFPFQTASLKDGAVTGNLGVVIKPSSGWQFNGTLSTGYRMPNVDDIGKLFESTPGNLTIPNPRLRPEYSWNYEVAVIRNVTNKISVEINGFYNVLKNAIVRRPFTFNGQDSILFDGILSRVEALQNVAEANVWGLQLGIRFYFMPSLYIQSNANWISGKETDEEKNEQVPLRHAPPFYGSTHLHFRKQNIHLELFSQYNSEIKNEDLAPSEQSKTDIYAKDDQGLPYSPGWYTVNLKASYQVNKNLMLTAGWENFTNQMYRPYSSGIVAAGSNLIAAVRFSFN